MPLLAEIQQRSDTVRVLLVEDSPDHQMLAGRALRQAGFDVEVASTGEAALERLNEGPDVHLVLVDQGLPGISGTEVLQHIVRIADGPGAIMVTASAASDLVIAAMRAGAVDFVSKESGYLDMLPAVVQRAHRQWDLRQRNRELQRLALLVHRSSSLQETIDEVVAGVCRLLRSPAGLLLVQDRESGTWREAARSGQDGGLTPDLGRVLVARDVDMVQQDGVLVVRLPSEVDEQAGALAVTREGPSVYLAEEEDLVRTFAAFASSALRQVRRAELEGGLIEELQQTIRARRDFVASVSHELRTPLTSIGGYAETILTHGDRISPEQTVDLVSRVRRHAGDLERLIDQLIDVAKIERGSRFTPTPKDLRLLAATADVLEKLEHVLDGRAVSVEVPDVEVHGDPDFVSRTLANLLTNAVKYSEPGTPIHLLGELRGQHVRLIVRDQGIGIHPNETVLAFQPFWRAAHAVAQAVRGTGIGLSLVHEYVKAMGGEVGCEPGPGGVGSDFWFTLPAVATVGR